MLISKYFFQFVDQMSWVCIYVLSRFMHILIFQQQLFSLNLVKHNLFHSLTTLFTTKYLYSYYL